MLSFFMRLLKFRLVRLGFSTYIVFPISTHPLYWFEMALRMTRFCVVEDPKRCGHDMFLKQIAPWLHLED